MIDLPSLVLDEIFSYLTFKEMIKGKLVSRRWMEEIELRERNRKGLVFHVGYFPINRPWVRTQKLMKISNSIELKSLTVLSANSTKCYLKKNLVNLRRVQIVNAYTVFNNLPTNRFRQCLTTFDQIEELELDGLSFHGDTLIELPKLRSFALRKVEGDRLVLNCPLLELLIHNSQFKKTQNKHPDQLKYLQCFDCNYLSTLNTKLQNLETLNFFDENCNVKADLLSYMPNLKKMVLYTDNGWNELRKLERQKQLYHLPNLKILICGFEGAPIRFFMNQATFSLNHDLHIRDLFMNYPRLVEPVNFDVCIDYVLLFERFRILPSNFFIKFPTIDSVVVSEVTSHTHLFAFLKHCHRLEHLTVQLSKINIQFLDQLFLLAPTLRILSLKEDQPFALFDYDYTFLFGIRVLLVRLDCMYLPDTFFVTIYRRCKYLLGFQHLCGQQTMSVIIDKDEGKPDRFGLVADFGLTEEFDTLEEFNSFMRTSPFIKRISISKD